MSFETNKPAGDTQRLPEDDRWWRPGYLLQNREDVPPDLKKKCHELDDAITYLNHYIDKVKTTMMNNIKMLNRSTKNEKVLSLYEELKDINKSMNDSLKKMTSQNNKMQRERLRILLSDYSDSTHVEKKCHELNGEIEILYKSLKEVESLMKKFVEIEEDERSKFPNPKKDMLKRYLKNKLEDIKTRISDRLDQFE